MRSARHDICAVTNSQYPMRFFALSFDKIVIRYFLMMAFVIGGVFSGIYWLAGFALPIFLSAILGISFFSAPAPEAKIKPLKQMTNQTNRQRA